MFESGITIGGPSGAESELRIYVQPLIIRNVHEGKGVVARLLFLCIWCI